MTESEIRKLLEEVEEYCSKATPGPWKPLLKSKGMTGVNAEECRIYHATFDPECLKETHDRQKRDAEFIARARTDLPKLAALLREKLEAERWIPVSERLPEEWDVVLTIGGSCRPRENFVRVDGSWRRWPTAVTHWRPLPAAPEVQG